jgi:hypothetical protein
MSPLSHILRHIGDGWAIGVRRYGAEGQLFQYLVSATEGCGMVDSRATAPFGL